MSAIILKTTIMAPLVRMREDLPAEIDYVERAVPRYYRNLKKRYRRWCVYRRTLAELNDYSPGELRGLGIAPSDIRCIAHQEAMGG